MAKLIKFANETEKRKALENSYPNTSLFQMVRPTLPLLTRLGNPISYFSGSLDVVDLGASAILVEDDRFLDLSSTSASVQFQNQIIDLDLYRGSGPGAAAANNSQNWGIVDAELHRLRDAGLSGKGIKVAIIDSGLDYQHRTFDELRSDGRLKAYVRFDRDGVKVEERFDGKTNYSGSHGTHCAGTICGNDTGAEQIGIAPGVELYVVHIIDQNNSFSVANLTAGLNWLADKGCDLVSMSLGWQGLRQQWIVEVNDLIEQGSFLICAAGNDYGSVSNYRNMSPANYPFATKHSGGGGMVSVGAIEKDLTIWSSSGGGTEIWSSSLLDKVPDDIRNELIDVEKVVPTLSAPGVEIGSSIAGNLFETNSGTSMAAPFVTGLLALVLEKLRISTPSATPSDAYELLSNVLSDKGVPGGDIRYGDGIIDKPAIDQLVSV